MNWGGFVKVLDQSGVTVKQMEALDSLRDGEWLSCKDVSDRLGKTEESARTIIMVVSRYGLVDREKKIQIINGEEVRKMTYYRISDNGLKLLRIFEKAVWKPKVKEGVTCE